MKMEIIINVEDMYDGDTDEVFDGVKKQFKKGVCSGSFELDDKTKVEWRIEGI